jgi:DNA polymerase-3 subunit chi
MADLESRTARLMRADFYLIGKPRFLEQPLLLVCELARKAHDSGQPLLILARDAAQAEELDELLWDFDEEAFLGHQIAGQQDDDDETPILIVPPGTDTPDRPLVINLRDDVAPGRYDRVLEVVPADPSTREPLRQRWREYQMSGAMMQKHDM